MDAYHPKRRITLSFAEWKGRDYIAVAHGGDASLRRRLSDEPGAVAKGGTVYIPADGFVLTDFFDRYVGEAFIDYSAIKESPPKPKPKPTQPSRPDLPPGFMEKLRQVRYSDHTVRVYTTYFRDFQEYFEGCDIDRITPEEINGYLVFLINEKGISTCQQNQRINAIKFYYEKVLGHPRRCYTVSRAKREKTLPDVLSKEEVRAILSAVVTDLRFWCMFSVLYSAGLRISELLALKPDDINVSRSLIRVRQGKGRKDRFTLLSKPLIKKLTEYRELYKPKVWLFERTPGEQFTESIVSKRLKAAAQEAGITKRIYPHLLRHSFATHLIEQGTDLKIVKELMGHNSIRTTEIYVHIADTFKSNIKSPLDDILEEDGL
ncbi:tyrosine-type recombinase/integrase [Bacteroides acidifaciens]|uniref:tyrosine-type recombinase/integrase n=1 Tax=Bacteroides acidifaciens TaxID=85831 RepID=UPI00272CF44E|nr:site-specific integrase [Bacteroides acidifaciens]